MSCVKHPVCDGSCYEQYKAVNHTCNSSPRNDFMASVPVLELTTWNVKVFADMQRHLHRTAILMQVNSYSDVARNAPKS